MELNLDFLTEQEIADLLDELGIAAHAAEEDSVLLEMGNDFASAKHCLCSDERTCDSGPDTFCIDMNTSEVVDALEKVVRKIHGGRTLMIPVGKWRSAFDAVAFSMAGDEPWQEFDASATIKLNTRDPLLFETGDEHTLIELVKSIMNDGELAKQGVFLIPVGSPLLLHIQPSGPVKFWFGNSTFADEVRETYSN